MKIGPFIISRVRRTKAGLTIYPWQALTEDRVTPELRQIVAKVARSEAKSYLQELQETVVTEEVVAGERQPGPFPCPYSTSGVCSEFQTCAMCQGWRKSSGKDRP